ncbi:hypothetical protein [Bifidobacterium vansinderenii]|uniref:Uncharacterized protein n=1 Tax=Bifidobacterium vansinderenii TaxID=1984871 RepID=A0A229VWD0_9BIFI|nr:hypothetical protein [Bifidobacterium vansinderenii]OXM99916.1 hypothetical protein Tam10B_1879 [Bifidobacterium vansinderenii]
MSDIIFTFACHFEDDPDWQYPIAGGKLHSAGPESNALVSVKPDIPDDIRDVSAMMAEAVLRALKAKDAIDGDSLGNVTRSDVRQSTTE